ncbi:MAG: hypothetical protein SOZ51_05795, partial [Eubacteriales bacterium]|nr:hypothetical protein [Eubacteriales bacterium]
QSAVPAIKAPLRNSDLAAAKSDKEGVRAPILNCTEVPEKHSLYCITNSRLLQSLFQKVFTFLSSSATDGIRTTQRITEQAPVHRDLFCMISEISIHRIPHPDFYGMPPCAVVLPGRRFS